MPQFRYSKHMMIIRMLLAGISGFVICVLLMALGIFSHHYHISYILESPLTRLPTGIVYHNNLSTVYRQVFDISQIEDLYQSGVQGRVVDDPVHPIDGVDLSILGNNDVLGIVTVRQVGWPLRCARDTVLVMRTESSPSVISDGYALFSHGSNLNYSIRLPDEKVVTYDVPAVSHILLPTDIRFLPLCANVILLSIVIACIVETVIACKRYIRASSGIAKDVVYIAVIREPRAK